MSDVTPNVDVPETDEAVEPAQPEMSVEELRRSQHEIWVSGTEERMPFADATDEGAQELLPRDPDPALDIQRGAVVDVDYVIPEPVVDAERQLGTLGPPHR